MDNQSIFNHSWIYNITGISRGRFSINKNNRFSSTSRASHHTPKTGAQERFNILVLIEILRKTDSLLNFGQARVQDYSTTTPSCVSDSDFFAGWKLHVGKMSPKRRGMRGTVRLQRLDSLTSTQPNDMEDETKEQGVDQLLEKLWDWVLPIKNSLCSQIMTNFLNEKNFFAKW